MNEERVKFYLACAEAGKPLPAPVLWLAPDGKYVPVTEDDQAIVEAARRYGVETVEGAYLLNCEEAKVRQIAERLRRVQQSNEN